VNPAAYEQAGTGWRVTLAPGGGVGSGKRGFSVMPLGNGRHFAGLSAGETGALAGAGPGTVILARVVSWPVAGAHATGMFDGLAVWPFVVGAVNSSDRPEAVTVT
jgi:hypothetical protein